MEVNCLACARTGGCFEATAIDDAVIIRIKGSVGAGGMNQPPDVKVIQQALNDIPLDDGGTSPPLKVDGIAGTLTRAAITNYQRKNVTIIDGRVDPNGPTLRSLNERLGSGEVDIVSVGTGAGGSGKKGKSPFQPLDPTVVVQIVSLLAKIKAVIRAADFHIAMANPFVGTTRIKKPTGPFQAGARLSLNMLDTVFDLGKLDNPRPSFENIRLAYRNMNVALNRSFETDPLIAPILFVPNKFVAMEKKAAAYTSMGGAFVSAKVQLKKLGVPANRIYLCNNLLKETEMNQVSVAVHELAHYISGRPFFIDDQVKEGRMLNKASKPAFDKLKPEQKIRSAEHYAFFALLAGFRQISD